MTDALGIGVEGAAGDWWCSILGLEWRSGLIHDPWRLADLRRDAPATRLLVMLRDPVARFTADQVTGPVRASANASFERGLYADLLSRLWRLFPRDQVFVLQQERCQRDPAAELAKTTAFVGLEATAAAPPTPPLTPAPSLRPDQRLVLARRYARENLRLATLVPDLELALWEAPA
jgi:hypothetical protein